MVHGKCHCGNVSLTIDKPSAEATQCNCSICSRYGAIWGYFQPAQVAVSIGEKGVSAYSHGDQCIRFISCSHCHCATHYHTTTTVSPARLAINYRMFDAEILEAIKIRYFDGAGRRPTRVLAKQNGST
ncbi:GFA family protein [Microbulbifer sp. 2201CG32-9]|uniref:GFA family protein n=1 Tax=Microbulbifer sp. 2201CG32-9 TaxID=3232309 RepID=UPI00345BD806